MLEQKIATRESYGEALASLGEERKEVVVLDADLSGATKTNIFAQKFPERFFDIGIAEQDMLGTAAGFATCGRIPFASTFAVFAAGRAYDQIRNSICYPNLNVKICATHYGVNIGEDGATHQMLEDIAMMRTLPNMTVLCPSDDTQTKWMIKEICKKKGPVYVRLARMETPVIYNTDVNFQIGKAIQIGEGTEATIMATGVTVAEAIKAKERLAKEGILVRVLDMYSLKPVDKEAIVRCAKETKRIITVEDHQRVGGLGSIVCEVLAEEYPCKVERMGIEDCFGKSGKPEELMQAFEIDAKSIYEKIKNS